ncbi:hypothetical protein C8N29_101256 [Agitococcus lubricus]|uniref:Phosphate-selective porin O/P n=2 Tax=Agitococcus lubricus TaxID=1077255 RepID=A0A2T5J3J3_9GAMM|nr:hypothetical protein C8N29_101256 [Agitococcus lubricus]
MMLNKLATAMLSLSVASSVYAQTTEAEIASLKAQLKAQQAQIDALVAAVEQPTTSQGFANTTLGGYGEAHYYNYDNAPQQYDAYRFVLYVGHKFSNTVRLHSELEVEHALIRDNPTGTTNLGEVELEQMFIEWNYAGKQNLSIGQIILPIGFLNETHEPETFYGTKRNPIETNLIPTTWWEGAVKASGLIPTVDGLSYNVLVSTGLKTDSAAIRSGRQKGAKAVAEDLAYTLGVNYRGIAGLDTGIAYQLQQDITQSVGKTNKASLMEAHVAYSWQGFSTRALYARWDVEDLVAADAHKAKQDGYFLEAAYKPIEQVGVFARYSVWDNEAKNTSSNSEDSEKQQWNYGANYYLTPRVVLKLDIQDQKLATLGTVDEDGFSLGIGYSF